MARSPRTLSDLSDGGSFIETRSKTFVLSNTRSTAEGAEVQSDEDLAGKCDFESLMTFVNTKFEKRERKFKRDVRDEIERRLDQDKRHQDEIITTLRRDLSHLTKISHECDGLREEQKILHQELNNQQEKVTTLREENSQLKADVAKIQDMATEIENLRLENDSLRRENVTLEMRSVKLKSMISEKDQELVNLKMLIDSQYKRIKLDLTNTRDKFHSEQETIHTGMKQQNLMLAEISAAVQTISTGIGNNPSNKKDARRAVGEKGPSRNKVFVASGKTSSETSFNKLTGYTQSKRQ